MYILAGLMGLMALGSVAFVTVGDAETDDDAFSDNGDDPDAGFEGEEGEGPLANLPQDGRSLFARMGLINMPGPASATMEPEPASGFVADMSDTWADEFVFRVAGDMGNPAAAPMPPQEMGLDLEEADLSDTTAEPAQDSRTDMLDYDPVQDQLLIIFDDSTGSDEPELELRISDADPETTEIRADDQVLARLPTEEAPPLSAIVLVGESDAAALGLAS